MNDSYINTVRLLLAISPVIFKSPHFAIKGGTALNLFVQDMPRLSIDIDVVFMDHQMPRQAALDAIADNLRSATTDLEALGYSTQTPKVKAGEDLKLIVRNTLAQVKVEVNYVFRGTLYPVVPTTLTQAAQDMFTTDITLPILQKQELYGSKLVAAMDRQHPRDLFDVQLMLSQFGLEAGIVDSFVAYLAGHNRPVHEVLFPRPIPEKNLRAIFESDFEGMTQTVVQFESLIATQAEIQKTLPLALTAAHRQFLLSLVRLEPDWNLMPYGHLKDLPAIQWKILNLNKLKNAKPQAFEAQYHLLKDRFNALTT